MIIINPLPINPHIFLTFTCLRYIYKWKLLVCSVRKKMYLYFFCQPRTPPPPWNITIAQLSTLQFRMPSLSLVPLFPTNTHHTAQPTHKKYIHTSCSQLCFSNSLVIILTCLAATLSSSSSPCSLMCLPQLLLWIYHAHHHIIPQKNIHATKPNQTHTVFYIFAHIYIILTCQEINLFFLQIFSSSYSSSNYKKLEKWYRCNFHKENPPKKKGEKVVLAAVLLLVML